MDVEKHYEGMVALVREGKSLTEMAEKFDVSISKIRSILKEQNLLVQWKPTLRRKQLTELIREGKTEHEITQLLLVNENEVRFAASLYRLAKEGLSTGEIAQAAGILNGTVCYRLKQFNLYDIWVNARGKTIRNAEKSYEGIAALVREGKSLVEMAETLGVSVSKIRHILAEQDLFTKWKPSLRRKQLTDLIKEGKTEHEITQLLLVNENEVRFAASLYRLAKEGLSTGEIAQAVGLPSMEISYRLKQFNLYDIWAEARKNTPRPSTIARKGMTLEEVAQLNTWAPPEIKFYEQLRLMLEEKNTTQEIQSRLGIPENEATYWVSFYQMVSAGLPHARIARALGTFAQQIRHQIDLLNLDRVSKEAKEEKPIKKALQLKERYKEWISEGRTIDEIANIRCTTAGSVRHDLHTCGLFSAYWKKHHIDVKSQLEQLVREGRTREDIVKIRGYKNLTVANVMLSKHGLCELYSQMHPNLHSQEIKQNEMYFEYEALIKQGKTIEEIAKLKGVKKGTVRWNFRRFGLAKLYRQHHSTKKTTHEDYERMIQEGKTIPEMASARGIREYRVYEFMRRSDLLEKYEQKHPAPYGFAKNTYVSLGDMVRKGTSLEDMANRCDVSPQQILSILRRNDKDWYAQWIQVRQEMAL